MSPRAPSLGYALLGLLHQKPSTGYGLRMVFEATPMGIYSSSPGAVYPALKKLAADGLVARARPAAGERAAPYRLTAKGRRALRAWLIAPVTADDVSRRYDILMLKLAFMDGLATADDVARFLDGIAARLEDFLARLGPFLDEPALQPCGRLALGHGAEETRARLAWARRARDAVRARGLAPDLTAARV